MTEQTRRLPSGESTEDVATYIAAWEAAAKPTAGFFGWTLVAFHPGLVFEDTHGERFALSVALVNRMNERLQR